MCGLLVPQSQSTTLDGLNYFTAHHPYRVGKKVLCSRTCHMLACIADHLERESELQYELILEGGSNAVQTSSGHDTRYASTRFGWVGAS